VVVPLVSSFIFFFQDRRVIDNANGIPDKTTDIVVVELDLR
jgi:hypothetical protein